MSDIMAKRQAISKDLGIIKSNTILLRTHCKDTIDDELLKALRIMYCNVRYLEQRYLEQRDKYGAYANYRLVLQLRMDYKKLAALLKDTDEFCNKYLKDTATRINNIWHTI